MRILLATPYSPFGEAYGGQLRSAMIHQALCTLGDVDVVLVREAPHDGVVVRPSEGVAAVLEWQTHAGGLNRFVAARALCAPLESALGRSLAQYDLFVGRHLYSLCKLPYPADARTLVDLDDFAPLLWSGGWRPRALADLGRQCVAHTIARRQLGRFGRYLFVSPRDRARLPTLDGDVVPNIPANIDAAPDFSRPSTTILFVGAMWYRPNADAMDWFTTAVWPLIRREEPAARLVIAGAAAPAVRARWNAIDGVSAPGFVEDLSTVYRDCAFAISPTRLGGGSNIKVPEALAHGRACVITPFSFAGFAGMLEAERDVLVADGAAAFGRACLALLHDASKRERLARAGHGKVSREFTRERFEAGVRTAVATLMSARAQQPSPQGGYA